VGLLKATLMMKRLILWTLLSLFGLFSPMISKASHLVGGDLTYKYYKGNYYILKFSVYRDLASGVALDASFSYKVYRASDNTAYATETCSLYSKKNVKPFNPTCRSIISSTNIEEGIYYDTIQIGSDTVGYHVVWMRGNRNASILNIKNPNSIGSVWYTFIPPAKYKNSSPQFVTTPLPFICASKENIFTQAIYDPDNDSMLTTNEVPYIANSGAGMPTITPPPFAKATYNSGYNVNYPFGTSAHILKVDSSTSTIDAWPDVAGNYVVSIEIKDYRYDPITKKTVLMGLVRRDYQYYVQNCSSNPLNKPPVFYKDTTGYTKYVSPDSSICFPVSSYDPNAADTIFQWATGSVVYGGKSPLGTFTNDTSFKGKYSGTSLPTAKSTFCWKPTCSQVTFTTPYVLTINIADDKCELVQENYKIYVKTRPILPAPFIKCVNVIKASEIDLTFTSTSPALGTFSQYNIYRSKNGSSTYTFIDSITNPATTSWNDKTISDADTSYYSYYIKSKNSCGLEGLQSDTVTSIRVKGKMINNRLAYVWWNKHRNYGKFYYRIYNGSLSPANLLDSTTNLNDYLHNCNLTIKPIIEVVEHGCASASLIGNPLPLKDNTGPNYGNRLLNVSVKSTSSINLTFSPSDSTDTKEYQIWRSVNGGSFSKLTSVANSGATIYNYTDASSINSLTSKYAYYIVAVDSCLNVAANSNSQSTAVLSATANHLSVDLNWKKYNGYTYDTVEVQRWNGSAWQFLKKVALTDSSATDNGLVCNKPYYYRVVYRSSTSGYYSLSDSVTATPKDTTHPAEVNIREVSIKNNTTNIITFLKDASLDVKQYRIQVSVNGGASSTVATVTPAAFPYSYTHSGLSNSANTYTYKVFALDTCTSNVSLTSESHQPVNIKGTAKPLSAKISWDYYTGFTSVKNYVVQKWNGSSWTDYKTLTNTDTTYTDLGLACNGKYWYRIKSVDNSADKGISYSDSVLVVPYDTVTPSKVNMLYATIVSGSKIEIAFNKVSDLRVNKYEVYQSINGASYTLLTTIASTGASSYKTTSTGLSTTSNRYYYKVISIDSCGGAKAKLYEVHSAAKISGSGKNLSNQINWNTYKGFVSVKNYTIQRWNGSSWSDIATTASGSDSSYLDTGLACNVPYIYRIKSNENGGDNQISYSDSIKLTPYDTIAPGIVNILYASVKNASNIEVAFKGVKDKDVKLYKAYVSTNGGAYTLLKTINFAGTGTYTFTHSSVSPLTNTYSYRVFAIDSCAANTSHSSETHRVGHISGLAKNLSNQLIWNNYQGFSTKNFTIQKFTGSGWSDYLTTTSNIDTTYLDTALGCNINQFYRIKYNENGGDNQFSYSDSVKLTPYDTIIPKRVAIKYATITGSQNVKLAWTGTKDKDVNRYYVSYKTASGASYKVIDTVYKDSVDAITLPSTITEPVSFYIKAVDSCANNVGNSSAIHTTQYLTTSLVNCLPEVKLKWIVYQGFPSISKYNIYRAVNGGTESLYKTISAPRDTFTDVNLNNRNSYTYRVEAVNGANSSYSSYSNLSTQKPFRADTPVIYSASKIITSATAGQIVLKWTPKASITNRYIANHDVYYRKFGSATWLLLKAAVPTSQDTIAQSGLDTRFSDYQYLIISNDSCGNKSDSSIAHKTMELKMTVGQLIHNLNWTAYQGFKVKNYYIQFLDNKTWVNTDTIAGNVLNKKRFPVACNRPVYYRIIASDGLGHTALSDTAGGQAIDTIPANKPILKNTTVTTSKSDYLTFRGSDSPDVYKYVILRQENQTGPYNTVASILYTGAGKTLNYTDKVNTQIDYHKYVVVTLDSCLNASISDTFANIQLQGIPQNLQNRLWWKPFKGYKTDSLFVQEYLGTKWVTIAHLKGSDTSYVHSNLQCNQKHIYQVYTTEFGGGFNSYSDSIILTPFDTTKPVPVVINYATVQSGNKIYVSWQKAGIKVKQYEVYIQSGANPYRKVLNTANLNATISGLNTLDSTYSVEIVSVDSCSLRKSNPSNPHTVIQLTGTALNLATKLDWSGYKGFTSIKQYIINKWIGGKWTKYDSVSNATLTFTDKNQQCNVAQYYKISGFDNTGAFLTQSDSTIVTPFDTVAPASTTLNYTTVLNGTQIKADWQKGVPKVKYYEVDIQSGTNPYRKITTLTNQLTYTISGLNTVDSNYSVRIIAIDSCSLKKSVPSGTHSVVALDGKALNLGVQLNWSGYVGFSGIKKYYINKWVGGKWVIYDSVSGSTLTYTDNYQPCNLTQYYKISGYDATGKYFTQSDSTAKTPFDTIRPASVHINYATVLSTSKLKLSYQWNPKTNLKYFEIYRNVNGGTFTKIATVLRDNSYIDNTVNTTANFYRYSVIGLDSCDLTNKSYPGDTATTFKVKTKTGGCKPFVTLTWTNYIGFPNKVDEYYILRKDKSNAEKIITTITAGTNTYTDNAVVDTTLYVYRVVAKDNLSGFTAFSDTISVQPSIYPRPKSISLISASISQTSAFSGVIDLRWEKRLFTDTFANAYRIYSSNSKYSGYSLLYTEPDTSVTFHQDVAINTINQNHYYYVVPMNRCKTEAFVIDTHKVILLQVKNGNLATSLSWNKYEGFNVKSYTVLKSQQGGKFNTIAVLNPTDTNYNDSNIRCKIGYSYKILATENLGFGATSYSDTVSIIGRDSIPPTSAKIASASVVITDALKGAINLTFKSAKETNRAGYVLYRMASPSSPSFAVVKSVKDTNTGNIVTTDNNLDTRNQTYSYYVVTFDSCGNNGVPSDTHTVINLKATAHNDYNTLSWNNYVGWKKWSNNIERRTKTSGWATLITYPSDSTHFVDPFVNCHVTYEYRITGVENGSTNTAFSNTDTVTAYENTAPDYPIIKNVTVNSTGTNNGSIQINWTPSKAKDVAGYIIYHSEDGLNFKQAAIIGGDSFYVHKGINTYRAVNYYKVGVFDSCGNNNINNIDIHKSIQNTVKSGNQEIYINWTNYGGFTPTRYELYKDGILIQTFTPDASGNIQDTFTDTLVICKKLYKYNVLTYGSTPDQVSSSNVDSTIAIDTKPPRPVHLYTASVSDNDSLVYIYWRRTNNFDANRYLLYRTKLPYGATEVLLTDTNMNDTSYVDTIKTGPGQYSYRIQVADACNNGSKRSNEGSIMVLKGKSESFKHTITWNAYSQWNYNVDYYNIYRKEDSGQWVLIANVPGSVNSYVDEKISDFVQYHCYKVEAVEKGGFLQTSRSFKTCLVQAPVVWMPNAFTPTMSTNLNDSFGPGGTYFKHYNMKIYNRWGTLIYSTDQGKPWDGKFNGDYAPEGVYIYDITIYGFEDTEIRKSGSFNVLR